MAKNSAIDLGQSSVTPLTQQEFAALPPGRRALERIYRSGWGPALYYLIEMWWLRMYFPGKTYMGTRRAEFI